MISGEVEYSFPPSPLINLFGILIMTMHLLKPHFTTTSYKKRRSKKPALQQDPKFLKKMGYTGTKEHKISLPDLSVERRNPTSDRIYSDAKGKRVSEEDAARVSSKYVIGQAYNKGGFQVLSEAEASDPSTGKRR